MLKKIYQLYQSLVKKFYEIRFRYSVGIVSDEQIQKKHLQSVDIEVPELSMDTMRLLF